MVEADDPFALIEKGNAFEAATNHWGSADMYSQASMCLRIRADNFSSQLTEDADANAKNQERRKIISLYRAQSLEYLYKARHCFIEAVKFENDQDRNRMLEVAMSGKGRLDPLCSMISSEESERRRCIFQTLFSGQDDVKAKEVQRDDEGNKGEEYLKDEAEIPVQNDTNERTIIKPAEDNINNLQESMEARLAKLNSSLEKNENIPEAPPPFISGSRSGGSSSDQSRLDNLQRGLKGLGVTLPDNCSNKDFIPDNLSDEDQVKLIIQQARDEVMIEKGTDDDNEDGIDENDSMFEGFEEEEDDIESLLAKAENLVAKTTSEINGGMDQSNSSIPSSTVELAQLRKAQALLLEARLCLEIGDAKYLNECANHEMNDESASSDGGGNLDDNGNGNEDETKNQRNDRNSARIKAKERVQESCECLKDILSGLRE
mmetsp:Transcript_17184/g.29058  ORF Transcript_17184/g.29058 Transcript_17184/m.29058 type:complete len:432 (-) Transcript_17184:323-1618(-)